MTEVVVGVRLVATGDGVVGQLRELRRELGDVRGAAAGTAQGARDLSGATAAAATGVRELATETDRAAVSAAKAAIEEGKLSAETQRVGSTAVSASAGLGTMSGLMSGLATSTNSGAQAMGRWTNGGTIWVAGAKQMGNAADDLTQKTAAQRMGMQQLGYQLGDVATMWSMGAKPAQIFGSQIGQITQAIQLMAGGTSRFAAFMGGPWGIALSVGAIALTPLISSLFETDTALKRAELGSNGLSSAQSVLGEMFDLTTGKIKSQNEMLILNARYTALNLRAEAAAEKTSSQRTFNFASSRLGLSTANTLLGALGVPVSGAFERARAVNDLAGRVRSGKISREDAQQEAEKLDYSGLKITKDEFQQAILDDLSNKLKTETANLIDKSINERSLDPALRRTGGNKRTPKGSAGAAARLAEFGEDTGSKIAKINDQFSELPSAVAKSNEALRQLDDITSDLAARPLTPNIEKLKTAIAGARATITESLTRPYTDFLKTARQTAEIDALILAGRHDEAEALQIVLRLQERMKPLSDGQLSTVLETVRAEQARAMVLRDQRALIQSNVQAVHDMRGALEQTVTGMLRGRFSAKAIISSIGNSLVNTMSQRIVENMFGDTLRALEKQATGESAVKSAGDKMAVAMDAGSSAVEGFAAIVRKATTAIDGGSGSTGATGGSSLVQTEQRESRAGAWTTFLENFDATLPPPIVVEGRRPEAAGSGADGNFVVEIADQSLRRLGIAIPKPLVDILGVGLGKLEKTLPSLMAGALQGSAASSMILGDRGSGIGGAIGGAIGKKVGEKFLSGGLETIAKGLGKFAGPLGSIAGGLIGGLVGGLFKKTQTGTATVGNVDGEGAVTGTAGNNQQRISAARGLASNALGALDQIIEQLGGELGTFSGSIGIRKKKFVVDPTGAGRTKGSGVTKYATEEEANAALLADLLADGAVKGVSAAVQKALGSSTDVQKALTEALKVQDVEIAIGGIGAKLAAEFKTFDRQADERLRIAKKYGFDVVELEKRNAADRLKLSEQLLADQVGGLQQLIKDMNGGDLFEGSAVERRQFLLAQIAKTQADVDAGKEGAGDELADYLAQLASVSKDVFGTTAGYANDRADILSRANAAIEQRSQQLANAQKSDPALVATNAALDENNEQNSQLISWLRSIDQRLAGLGSPVGTLNLSALSALARTS